MAANEIRYAGGICYSQIFTKILWKNKVSNVEMNI